MIDEVAETLAEVRAAYDELAHTQPREIMDMTVMLPSEIDTRDLIDAVLGMPTVMAAAIERRSVYGHRGLALVLAFHPYATTKGDLP